LIDTGSVTIIVNEKIARQLGLKFGPTDRTVALYSANGLRMPVLANVDKFQINKDIPEKQKYKLLTLLRRYKDVFARSLEEIKQYPHYELYLDLLSDRQVFRRQFRLHPDNATKKQRQIDKMYQAGVIENAPTADYNSPIFLVAKKCLKTFSY